MSKTKTNSVKLQVTIGEYQDYLLNGLVVPYGSSKSDVIKRIIIDWVDEHPDILKQYNLSYENWKKQNQSSDKN